MYLYKIPKQEMFLKKKMEVPVDLKNKVTHTLEELYLKIEHPLEHSIRLLFIFQNTNGSVFRYPKDYVASGQPIKFDDRSYSFEGPIKSIKIVSDVDIQITVN